MTVSDRGIGCPGLGCLSAVTASEKEGSILQCSTGLCSVHIYHEVDPDCISKISDGKGNR